MHGRTHADCKMVARLVREGREGEEVGRWVIVFCCILFLIRR